MSGSAVWPHNIIPALVEQAKAACVDCAFGPMLDVPRRVVVGLRELWELEPGRAEVGELIELMEVTVVAGGGAFVAARHILTIMDERDDD